MVTPAASELLCATVFGAVFHQLHCAKRVIAREVTTTLPIVTVPVQARTPLAELGRLGRLQGNTCHVASVLQGSSAAHRVSIVHAHDLCHGQDEIDGGPLKRLGRVKRA